MLYIKKIVKTDRDGIFEFQFGPGYDFLHADTNIERGKNSGPHNNISFVFEPIGQQFIQYSGRKIKAQFYCTVAPDIRFTSELKNFLFVELMLQIGDIMVLKRPETTQLTKDSIFSENIVLGCITRDNPQYSFFDKILQTNSDRQSGFTCVVADGHSDVDNDVRQEHKPSFLKVPVSYQKIFYGAPGTGKSYRVSQIIDENSMEFFRTTFHPDYDYANFVGTYKPVLDIERDFGAVESDNEKQLTYRFVPQVFAKAYVQAWKNFIDGKTGQTCLVIEEINRGNCAQIFGDIFQLLDRNENTGFSKYNVYVDDDFESYLYDELAETSYVSKIQNSGLIKQKEGFDFHNIWLPPNLCIFATMNTSDQSLFPMDSAFKRRWDWEYIKIDYDNEKISDVQINIGNERFRWGDFLRNINKKIYSLTMSEDKQLGPFFITARNNVIEFDAFRDKVFFYLWYEIYKDETDNEENIFTKGGAEDDVVSFSDLFARDDGGASVISHIMKSNLLLDTV